MDKELTRVLDALKANKPRHICIDAGAADAVRSPDCLSIEAAIFRNRGWVNGREAVPFVELTPELLAFLRNLYA